jgi:hypothetical protein
VPLTGLGQSNGQGVRDLEPPASRWQRQGSARRCSLVRESPS